MVERKEALNENRLPLSKKLIFSAWCIEIIAAAIGLFLAIMLLEQGYQADKSISYSAVAIGSLPLVIVAIVELMKIPLVSAIYVTQERLKKILFILGLLILVVITFETFFIAFEQSNAIRLQTWETAKRNLDQNQSKIISLKTESERLKSLTLTKIRTGYGEERANLLMKFKDQEESLNGQIRDAERRYGGATVIKLQKKIEEIKARYKEDRSKFESMRASINRDYEKDRKYFEKNKEPLVKTRKTRLKELKLEKALSEKNLKNLNQTLFAEIDAANLTLRKNQTEKRNSLKEERDRRIKNEKVVFVKTEENYRLTVRGKREELNLLIENATTCTFCEEEEQLVKQAQAELKSIEQAFRERSLSKRLTVVNDWYSNEIKALEKNLAKADSAKSLSIRRQIKQVTLELTQVNAEIKDIKKQIDQIMQSLQLNNLNKERLKNIAEANRKQKIALDRRDQEIKTYRLKIESYLKDQAPKLKPIQNKIQIEKQRLRQKLSDELKDLDATNKTEINRYKNQGLQIVKQEQEIQSLTRERELLLAELKDAGRQQVVIRLAKMWYAEVEDETDVTEEHTKWMSTIWFGSLALIIAVAGALFAYASLVVRYGRRSGESNQGLISRFFGKLGRRLQFILIAIRQRIKKPKIVTKVIEKEVEVFKEVPVEVPTIKEVIKEVPVEKVVIQEVPKEVIREVVKKEVIHVPIATDDLKLLKVQKSSKSDDEPKENKS